MQHTLNFLTMSYDEALKRIDEIMREIEATQAMSMTEFKMKSAEAKQLIEFCRKELMNLEEDIKSQV